MGFPSRKHYHARHRDGQDRGYDQGKAPPCLRRLFGRATRFAAGLILVLAFSTPAQTETLRIATFNAELSRRGPGLLLRDILRGNDPQIEAVLTLIARADPDIIVLQGIDHDADLRALYALSQALRDLGHDFPHLYAPAGNAGLATGLDLDGDKRLGGPDDNHGYGRFTGAGAMAMLSRHPVDHGSAEDFSTVLWRDLPGNLYPTVDDVPFAGADAYAAHRLSARSHWSIPVDAPAGRITLWTWHATPPVFDGPEDRNGRRNHDEAAFWLHRLEEVDVPLVLLGTANIDPDRGEGRPEAITALLSHPRLQDPHGPAPTADFSDPSPGDLRVDYILPSTHWRIADHGRLSDPEASRHALLWVDIKPAAP